MRQQRQQKPVSKYIYAVTIPNKLARTSSLTDAHMSIIFPIRKRSKSIGEILIAIYFNLCITFILKIISLGRQVYMYITNICRKSIYLKNLTGKMRYDTVKGIGLEQIKVALPLQLQITPNSILCAKFMHSCSS